MKNHSRTVKHKIFSRKKLLSYGTPNSQDRGENLYEWGSVTQVKVTSDKVEARIIGSGSRIYKTSISWSEQFKEWDFECSCPYDFGGICKHSIALGLWMIDKCRYVDDKAGLENADHTKELDLLFNKADSTLVKEYLYSILNKDMQLYKKFRSKVLHLEIEPLDIPFDKVVKTYEETFLMIELSSENDILLKQSPYDDEDYYRDRWSIRDDFYREEIGDCIGHLFDQIETMLEDEITLKAIQSYCLLQEAYADYVEKEIEYDYDDYDSSLNDGCEVLENYIYGRFGNIATKIRYTKLSKEVISKTFDFLKNRYLNLSCNKCTGLSDEFLMSINWEENQALELLDHIRSDSDSWDNSLLYYLANLSNDEKLKTEICEKIFYNNESAARYLLNKYIDNTKEYYRITTAIINANFAEKLLPSIFENIKPELDNEIYLILTKKLFTQTGDLKYYLLSKKYSSNFNYLEYSKALESSFFAGSRFDIFLEEEDYEGAFDIYKENLSRYSDSFRFLAKIINILPEKCFDFITEQVKSLLEIAGSRSTYKYAGQFLVSLKTIENMNLKEQGQIFTQEICQKYKMRPAMLDEFKKLGLI